MASKRTSRPPLPSRSELREQVAELAAQQAAMSEVLRAIASSPHDLQPVFETILDSATRLCRVDSAALRLSEEGGPAASHRDLRRAWPPSGQDHHLSRDQAPFWVDSLPEKRPSTFPI